MAATQVRAITIGVFIPELILFWLLQLGASAIKHHGELLLIGGLVLTVAFWNTTSNLILWTANAMVIIGLASVVAKIVRFVLTRKVPVSAFEAHHGVPLWRRLFTYSGWARVEMLTTLIASFTLATSYLFLQTGFDSSRVIPQFGYFLASCALFWEVLLVLRQATRKYIAGEEEVAWTQFS